MHIGIIPDGNRRWLVKNKSNNIIDQWIGMVNSAVGEYMTHSEEYNDMLSKVSELTIYITSSDNVKKRCGSKSIKDVYSGVHIFCDKFLNMQFISRVFNFNFVGDLGALPPEVICDLDKIKNACVGNITINVAINYDYTHAEYKNSPPPIDIVYRSGGEKRLSGFFPIQTAYAELLFDDALWPDVKLLKVIKKCVTTLELANRNFGA